MVSNLDTSAQRQRSIVRSNSGVKCKILWSNAIWLVTVECDKSCDSISLVKLIIDSNDMSDRCAFDGSLTFTLKPVDGRK